MEFIKLNYGWNADPNSPAQLIKIKGTDLLLSFYMNHYIYEAYSEDDLGVLTFHNCIQFRQGSLNDEGFFVYGGDKYKPHGIIWGEFYRIVGVDWKNSFYDPIYIDNDSYVDDFNHYLFYFRDNDFECIASSYDFHISKRRP